MGERSQPPGIDLTQPQPLPPEPSIGLAFDAGTRAVAVAIDEHLARNGFADIRPAHGRVFETVSGEGSRITDMAGAALLTKQAMQYLVDDLERLGYAERLADPADRRAKLVRLTPRGRQAVLVARDAIKLAEREWEARLGEEKMRQLGGLLSELVAVIAEQERERDARSRPGRR
jgi:DNA-binding MarR family transcriptional regulator